MGNGFIPSDISGQKIWVKPDGLLYNGSNLVHQWTDASGEDNHLLQATESNKPLRVAGLKNGHDGVRFDGIDNFLKAVAFAWEQPETIYMVFNVVSWGLGDRLFDGNTATQTIVYMHALTPDLRMYAGSLGTIYDGYTIGTYNIMTAIYNGASSVFQQNNIAEEISDVGLRDSAGFTLGADATPSSYSNIEVMEVAGYDTVNTADERTSMKNYFSKKYQIAL